MPFASLGIIEPILKSLHEEGYRTPTPIQAQAIPIVLEGRDLLGVAQTGTGKTAAFAIPIIQLLSPQHSPGTQKPHGPILKARKHKPIRSLILTPTRELAVQIDESFKAYGRHARLSSVVIFGGVKQHQQTLALNRGVDIVVATPGRLLDLMDQRYVSLQDVEIFVLDEADRMLDMGFVRDVKKILAALPKNRQSLFFSATMPPAIVDLAHDILHDAVRVEVKPVAATVDLIKQSIYYVDKAKKNGLLIELLKNEDIRTALVFTRTKRGADVVVKTLTNHGIRAEAIHGNKSQNVRQRALSNFKAQTTRVLVATDIAARGIDVDDLEYVINYEIPNVPETYVHRIGRTGRAGAAGTAISFCSPDEKAFVRDIEKLTGKRIPAEHGHPFTQGDRESQSHPEHSRPPHRQQSRPGTPSSAPRGQHSRPHDQGPRPDSKKSAPLPQLTKRKPQHSEQPPPKGPKKTEHGRNRRRPSRP